MHVALREHWLFREPLWYRMHRYPLLAVLVALLIGASLSRLAGRGVDFVATTSLFAGSTLLVSTWLLLVFRRHFAAVVCALLAVVCVGTWQAARSKPASSDSLSAAASRKSEPLAVRAVISVAAVWRPNPNHRLSDPGSQAWMTQWEVDCLEVLDRERWRAIDVKSTLSVTGRIDEFLPGDVVEVYGSFRRIHDPTNPGAFDLAEHFRKEGQFISLSADGLAQMQRVGKRSNYALQRIRAWAVREVDRSLHRWVPFDQATLAAALVFGQREQVDWQDQQQLMATGTLHMLAISGMHVEIVAWGVLLVCLVSSASNRVRLLSVVTICGLYAALAGGKPPVIRAVVLVAAFEVARCLGRRARLSNLLCLAAIVLFFLRITNIENVGVHLSFLAVASIGIFVLDRRQADETARAALQAVIRDSLGTLSRTAGRLGIWLASMFKLSFWVWLMTCPLVWANFHVIAPVAILLNVLIAVPLTISLMAGVIAGLLGWIPWVGWMAGLSCGAGLKLVSYCVELGNAVPCGHAWLPSPPLWWIVLFYAWTSCWLLLFGRERRMFLAASLMVWVGLGVGLFAWGPKGFLGGNRFEGLGAKERDHELRVTFLDVGHGTSVILEMPDGRVWLYDAGHLGAAERSHQEIATALWNTQTARIDTLILSHADADHYNATQGLIERFKIGRIVSTTQFWTSEDRDVRSICEFVRNQGTPEATWSAGMAGSLGAVAWAVLHPGGQEVLESDNASSLCLQLEFGGKRILLPGDLEGSGLRSLVELPSRPCHVLMAPHHGSMSIDPTELLDWCRPELIVISGSHRANRREVIEKYSTESSDLAITFRDGAIQYRVTQHGDASVWHWQKNRWQPF